MHQISIYKHSAVNVYIFSLSMKCPLKLGKMQSELAVGENKLGYFEAEKNNYELLCVLLFPCLEAGFCEDGWGQIRPILWKSLRSPVLEDQRERKQMPSNKITVVLRMIEKIWFSFPKIAINSFIVTGQWKAEKLYKRSTFFVFAPLFLLAKQKGSCWKAAEKFPMKNWAGQGLVCRIHENIA